MHDGYPLASEKIKVTKEMLSKYQLKIVADYNFSLGKHKKLIPNLAHQRRRTPLSNIKT